jgi:hypothetical protein
MNMGEIMLTLARAYLVSMAIVFGAIGIAALSAPDIVAGKLELLPQSIKGTAEIRGLYGGGFISWCLIILGALRYRSKGMLIAMALTMGAIALARVVSVFADHDVAFNAPGLISEVLIAIACWKIWKDSAARIDQSRTA